MGKKLYDERYINSSAVEISKKLGLTEQFRLSDFPDLIKQIGPKEPKDINFYDIDGTIVSSWTLAQLNTATSLPALPNHEGLINSGWGWTLDQLKEINAPMNVGCTYRTDDGSTRFYVHVPTNEIEVQLNYSLDYGQAGGGSENPGYIYVDWGDGETWEIDIDNMSEHYLDHQYEIPGDYVIKINIVLTPDPEDFENSHPFCEFTLGYDGWPVVGPTTGNNTWPLTTRSVLYKVELGRYTKLSNNCFRGNPIEVLSLYYDPTYHPTEQDDYVRSGMYTFLDAPIAISSTCLKALILPPNYGNIRSFNWASYASTPVFCAGYRTIIGDRSTGSQKFSHMRNQVIYRDRYNGNEPNIQDRNVERVTAVSNLITIANQVRVTEYDGNEYGCLFSDLYLPLQFSVPMVGDNIDNWFYLNCTKIHIPAELVSDFENSNDWASYFPDYVIGHEEWPLRELPLWTDEDLIANTRVKPNNDYTNPGLEYEEDDWYSTDYIEVLPGERIALYILGDNNDLSRAWCFYDVDKNPCATFNSTLNRYMENPGCLTFYNTAASKRNNVEFGFVPEGAHYLRVSTKVDLSTDKFLTRFYRDNPDAPPLTIMQYDSNANVG